MSAAESHRAEWELVAAAETGDREAFAQLWSDNRLRVAHFIAGYVPHRPTVEDLVGDTFLKAWANLDRVRDQGKQFVAWLISIARNIALDHLKKSNTKLCTTVGSCADMDELGLAGVSPNSGVAFARLDAGSRMGRYLERLPLPQQRSLGLRYGAELSAEDAGKVLGMTAGAVKSAQHRGREHLKTVLIADGYASVSDFLEGAA